MQPLKRNELKATIKIDGIDEMVLSNFMKAFKKADHNVTGDEMLILGDTSKGFGAIQSRVRIALDNAAINAAEKKITTNPPRRSKSEKGKNSGTKRKTK